MPQVSAGYERKLDAMTALPGKVPLFLRYDPVSNLSLVQILTIVLDHSARPLCLTALLDHSA